MKRGASTIPNIGEPVTVSDTTGTEKRGTGVRDRGNEETRRNAARYRVGVARAREKAAGSSNRAVSGTR